MEATAQEIFDKVVTHLRTQGSQAIGKYSSGDSSICLYRAPDGKKCALGCLISDEEYLPEFEYQNLTGLLGFKSISTSLRNMLETHRSLLTDLQRIHDESDVGWEMGFLQVSENHNLIYTPKA